MTRIWQAQVWKPYVIFNYNVTFPCCLAESVKNMRCFHRLSFWKKFL